MDDFPTQILAKEQKAISITKKSTFGLIDRCMGIYETSIIIVACYLEERDDNIMAHLQYDSL
jgi:hypothetical protein